jgi:hypothetical protein
MTTRTKKTTATEPSADKLEEQGRQLRVAELRERLGDEVTLYPLDGVFVPDVQHVAQTVDAERAEELLRYSPAAFTTVAPEPPAEADPPEPQPSGDAGATPQEA